MRGSPAISPPPKAGVSAGTEKIHCEEELELIETAISLICSPAHTELGRIERAEQVGLVAETHGLVLNRRGSRELKTALLDRKRQLMVRLAALG